MILAEHISRLDALLFIIATDWNFISAHCFVTNRYRSNAEQQRYIGTDEGGQLKLASKARASGHKSRRTFICLF